MKILEFNKLNSKKRNKLYQRPAIDMLSTYRIVQPILSNIKTFGIKAVLNYSKKYDGFTGKQIKVTNKEFEKSEKLVSSEFRKAVRTAVHNITKFHKMQLPQKYSVETISGITCTREFRPIENVGLYIPGGTAILPSTGIPERGWATFCIITEVQEVNRNSDVKNRICKNIFILFPDIINSSGN